MPQDQVPVSPKGWPYIDPALYFRAFPAYTKALSAKLDNADADVAAAINAANVATTKAAEIAAAAGTIATHTTQIAKANDNVITIGGVDYQRSGSWPQQTLSGPAFTSGVIYCFSVTQTLPYAPPAGYTFTIDQRFSAGYSTVSTGAITAGSPGTVQVRVTNINANSFAIRLGWQLVKV